MRKLHSSKKQRLSLSQEFSTVYRYSLYMEWGLHIFHRLKYKVNIAGYINEFRYLDF